MTCKRQETGSGVQDRTHAVKSEQQSTASVPHSSAEVNDVVTRDSEVLLDIGEPSCKLY